MFPPPECHQTGRSVVRPTARTSRPLPLGELDAQIRRVARESLGIDVAPLVLYARQRLAPPAADDLIVLSSHTYELAMWNELADVRRGGTQVLALYHDELMTDSLKRLWREQASDVEHCVESLVPGA